MAQGRKIEWKDGSESSDRHSGLRVEKATGSCKSADDYCLGVNEMKVEE
jgi:hypothetical protein